MIIMFKFAVSKELNHSKKFGLLLMSSWILLDGTAGQELKMRGTLFIITGSLLITTLLKSEFIKYGIVHSIRGYMKLEDKIIYK